MNAHFVIVVAVSVALQIGSQHNALMGRVLKTSYLPFADCRWFFPLGAIPLFVLELAKVVRSRARPKQPPHPPALAPTP